MAPDVLFAETQRFRQWWLWLLLLAFDALFLAGAIGQIVGGHPFGDRPASNGTLLFSTGLLLLLTFLFGLVRLQTQVRSDGIYVRFLPFQRSFRHYHWHELSQTFVRQYNAIGEYGGWGIRLGLFGRGRAYNVSGNKGLQLQFTDGRKLLVGTQKPAELEDVLRSIGQLKRV